MLKRSFLLDTAEDDSLTVVGGNVGVPRPPQSSDDDLFRRLIPVLAWQPKTIKFTTYMLLTAVFGSQADLITANQRPWKVFEFTNEFVLEIPLSLITSSNENASYLHGISGYGSCVAGPAGFFTMSGNINLLCATTLVGKTLQMFYGGVWNNYTITATPYTVVGDFTTVNVSVATIPAGGGFVIIDIPGDGVATQPGDFITASAYSSSFTTDPAPDPTDTISVLGDATQHLAEKHLVTLSGAPDATYEIIAMTYSVATNRTTMQFAATTIPANLSGQVVFHALEEADTLTTAPHDLRVYLTGLGLLEVVIYYMNLLVRAAGIVMRVELI